MGIWKRILFSAGCFLSLAVHAAAQTPSTRADVSGMIGWLGSEFSTGQPRYSTRWDSAFHGSVEAGWHWTEHLKTEIDFGAATETRAFFSDVRVVNNAPVYQPVHRTISKKTIGIGQQYQFLRNAWFHPHLAVGANITWERRTDEYQPFVVFDPVTRISRVIEDRRRLGPETDVVVRPYVAGGFKAYMTRRAFFRSDLRVAFKSRAHEALARLGFGVDF